MTKNKLIDHTLLAAEATQAQIVHLCNEAKEFQFYAVCINPYWVPLAVKTLDGSDIKVCTVIGFPLGTTTSTSKAFEAQEAVKNGADEVDMVLNIGLAKMGDWHSVQADIKAVVDAVQPNTVVKVILETSLLTDDEIAQACTAAVNAGANFVKTSTGLSTAGATTHHVQLMRKCVGENFGVKASGGIHNAKDFEAMIAAGANRIGASAGIALLDNNKSGDNNVY